MRHWRIARGVALACAMLVGAAAGGCVGDYLPGVPAQTGTPQAYDYYPFTAQGYVIRWAPGTNIRLWLPNCTGLVTGCQPTFSQDVLDGINAWASIHALLGISLTVCTVVPSLCMTADDVRVIWDDGTGSSGYPIAPGVIGFAAIVEPPATTTRIIVMTTRCNICPGWPSHDPADIRAIATHEWGHMLGVWNHSFDPADLMYPYKTAQTSVSNRDAWTLLKAYSEPPALDLSGLPPNMWTDAGAAVAADTVTPTFLIRFLHSYGVVPTTTVEFHPPDG